MSSQGRLVGRLAEQSFRAPRSCLIIIFQLYDAEKPFSLKLSTLGIPLLVGIGAVFYLVDSNMLPFFETDNNPEATSPEPAESKPTNPKPKSKHRGYGQCVAFSNEQYKRDMAKFDWIRQQPEVDYGRLRDDRYGKGLNTITSEKLEREKKCFEDGMY